MKNKNKILLIKNKNVLIVNKIILFKIWNKSIIVVVMIKNIVYKNGFVINVLWNNVNNVNMNLICNMNFIIIKIKLSVKLVFKN